MCVDAGLRMWARSLPVLRKEKTPDAADFSNMMLASTMAGMAIAHTATTLPHGLSYAVTTHLNVPHGKATAYWLRLDRRLPDSLLRSLRYDRCSGNRASEGA